MKILVISQQWEPESGTPQRRWAHFTQVLTNNGNEVVVVAAPPHYPGGVLTHDDPQFAPRAVSPGLRGETVWRTRFSPHDRSLASRVGDQAAIAASSLRIGARILRRRDVDVILTTAPPIPSAVVSALLGWWYKVPYVIDLRDVWPDLLLYMNEWGNKAEANPRQPFKAVAFDSLILVGGRAFKRALKAAAGIVTTTPSFAEKLRAEGFTNVLNVRNMASVRPEPLSKRVSAPLDEEQAPLRILYAGTTGRAQGLDNALESLRLAKEAGANVTMRIVGSGAHLRLLELHAERDDLPVEFLGRLDFEEVIEQYEWCDTALVHLRNWKPLSYTVPSKLYEALSLGRHVTVAANGESARIVKETGAGIAVPSMKPKALAAAWVNLAKNRAALDVGERGRQWLLDRETCDENAAKLETFVRATVEALPAESRRGGNVVAQA